MIGTIAEYARYKNMRSSSIHNAIRDGRIPIDEQTRLINFEDADAHWASTHEGIGRGGDNRSPASRARRGFATGIPAEKPTLVSVKIEAEQVKVERGRIELAEKLGALVKKDLVNKLVFAMGKGIRDAVENCAVHIAPMVSGKTDLRDIEEVIRGEIRSALAAAADQAEHGEFTEDIVDEELAEEEGYAEDDD